jgi:tetratricopeptide (TPR) repeat protein
MRWRVTLICALAFSLALPLPPARATLQQDYLEIYLKLNDSERLERNGDFKGALEGFQDCYAKLHKIHVSNPDWERVLVNSRMDDCRAKINELEPKVDYSAPTPPASPESVIVQPVTPGTAPTSLGDDATLKARLSEVEQELQTTRQELADTQEKYKNSQLEVQTLHAQIDSVNQELASLKNSGSVDENMGKLLTENKALTDKLTAAQAEVKALTSNPKSAVAKLSVQLKNMQDKLAASEAANAGLTETTSTLQQQLDQAQKDLAAANQKLATTGPGSPEYLTLKRENEVMRGILLREIQEQSRRDGAKRLAQEEFDRLKISSRVLQEQLDILGSPMSPPTSDEERSLLESLRVTPAEPTPLVDSGSGNNIGVTTNAVPETNAASITTPDTNTVAAVTPPVTNAPAVDTNTVAATTTPPADTNSVIVVPAPPPDTNNVTVATDTNAPPATNTAPAITEATPPSTNSTPEPNAAPVATETNAVPATTNVVTAPPDTNAPAASTPPSTPTNTETAATTTTTTTTSTDTNAPAAAADTDPTRYSTKPRLPDDMREVAQQATDLFANKRYDEAAAKYQTIIDKYPESLYAWSNLGVVRSQQGGPEHLHDAMTALQQAVKLSPNDAFYYRNLGIVYYQLNQNDAAIDALERSIALDPNNVYSHDYLGCACSQKGWQEVAEKEFRKAIEIDDNFPDAHYNLAIVYAMQKPPSLELARRHYKRALELGIPKDARLEKLLGL